MSKLDLPGEDLEEVIEETDEETLPLKLILLDEYRRAKEQKRVVKETKEYEGAQTSITIQQKEYTADKAFKLEDSMHEMPFDGSGKLKDVILISDKSDYRIKLEADSDYILNDNYSYLNNITSEVEDLSVYTKDDNYFLAMGNIPFKKRLFIKVYPQDEITFSLIRADITLY